jgi:hypothetical protein
VKISQKSHGINRRRREDENQLNKPEKRKKTFGHANFKRTGEK